MSLWCPLRRRTGSAANNYDSCRVGLGGCCGRGGRGLCRALTCISMWWMPKQIWLLGPFYLLMMYLSSRKKLSQIRVPILTDKTPMPLELLTPSVGTIPIPLRTAFPLCLCLCSAASKSITGRLANLHFAICFFDNTLSRNLFANHEKKMSRR